MKSTSYSKLNFPFQIQIDINSERLATVQSEAEEKMPNTTAQHNYILNSLCLDAVSHWLDENIAEEDESIVIPQTEYLESCWSVVSGTPLSVNSIKVVIIPSDRFDLSGISVPREWVDIPQWTPDYYIATQLDLEQNSILIWGYVHSNTIKQQAVLNQTHQYYTLPLEKMSLDIELLGITRELVAAPQSDRSPSVNANNLNKNDALAKLSTPSPYSPRLVLPFDVWSGLISDRQWCRELYKQRCLNSQTKSSVTKLLQWLKSEAVSTLDSGWKELNEIFSAFTDSPQLSYALRSDLQDMEDWVKKVKVIDLKLQLDRDSKIVLLIAITQKAENKYSIVAQLHPDSKQKFVPEAIGFQLIHDGKVLQETTSRSQDRYLQMGFTSQIETSFSIKITSHRQVCFEEDFLV